MKLDDIGFYTLSERRAQETSFDSCIQRAEIILTSKCNFRCPYCRGIRDSEVELSSEKVFQILDLLKTGGVQNIRFSGGEPTLWPDLTQACLYANSFATTKHIAISTNGTAPRSQYLKLIEYGVNDLSISLDACCSSTGDLMSGKTGYFQTVVDNIRALSNLAYVTVGVVLTPQNILEVGKIIEFASSLGVADIRLIPAAQVSTKLGSVPEVTYAIIKKHPILRWRLSKTGLPVRGLGPKDPGVCHLVKDDMVFMGFNHYPCIIYMREGGKPIGSWIGKTMPEIREERRLWMLGTQTTKDTICSANCLDFCKFFNARCEYYARQNESREL